MASSETVASGVDATPWHAMPAGDIERQLKVDPAQGLEAEEAVARLASHGPNRLPQGKKNGPLARFIAQFNNILIYVLLASGFIKLMLSLWLDATIIFVVVVLNSLLGFLQEGRAEKALDSIRNMLSAQARVLRGGVARLISAEELVPGDIVLLESGDKIPADLRLIEVKNLRAEEAALTGEAVPAEKLPGSCRSRPRWGTGRIWRSPARWSCPAGPAALSWPRAARRSWAGSTRCSPRSARSRRRCCVRSRNSAMSLRRPSAVSACCSSPGDIGSDT